MKIHNLALGMAVLAIIGSQNVAAKLPLRNPKIDDFVQKQFAPNHKISNATVLVLLKEQANLDGADALPAKEKGKFVYNKLRSTALNTQGPLVEYLKSKNLSFRQFYIENMIAVDNASYDLVTELAKRNDVARIMGNPLTTLKLPAAQPETVMKKALADGDKGPEQSLVRVGATKVWDTFNDRGEGIVVASQDTGVQWDHPALIHQYRGTSTNTVDHNYNWHDSIHKRLNLAVDTKNACGYDTQAPCDDYGHGTHTVGTMVGDDGKGNQIGVAPKAQWVGCRNMDSGAGTPASYIECFEFFLAPYPLNGNPMTDGDPARAPHIINNSWGCERSEGCRGDEVLPALQAMKKAGIFIIASAGNDGPSCGTIDAPPAWHTGMTMSVAAFNHRNDEIAYFSSRGPSSFDGGKGPNISAPGVSIRSSVPHNDYSSYSGTSMAGPHAVGVAALLWSFNKNLIGNINDSIAVLENSAEPKTTTQSCDGNSGAEIPNNTYGFGLINAYRAVCSQSGHCS